MARVTLGADANEAATALLAIELVEELDLELDDTEEDRELKLNELDVELLDELDFELEFKLELEFDELDVELDELVDLELD